MKQREIEKQTKRGGGGGGRRAAEPGLYRKTALPPLSLIVFLN